MGTEAAIPFGSLPGINALGRQIPITVKCCKISPVECFPTGKEYLKQYEVLEFDLESLDLSVFHGPPS